ncbi:MAG: ribosomal protein S18-alanine N-acetyltransferase [Thauera sp.]|uniref:ribosomal protein S18-alanine N-acetyltransferase n=1 Tax=Thauera sp. JM12B12 TaxID=3142262 RepID=UPI0029C366E2|nr:ribosomal protein S18-alanine N-acetyltransferase [Thauera sp.]
MPELSFVAMRAEDLDWVAAREAELHAYPWSRGNFADSLAAGHDAWIMRHGDDTVGYAIVLKVLDEAHLLDIGIVASAQGQGLGQSFMAWLCGEAREGGAETFYLEVRPSNAAALRLYQRMGFEEIGRRRAYYPAGSAREDAIVMRRVL